MVINSLVFLAHFRNPKLQLSHSNKVEYKINFEINKHVLVMAAVMANAKQFSESLGLHRQTAPTPKSPNVI